MVKLADTYRINVAESYLMSLDGKTLLKPNGTTACADTVGALIDLGIGKNPSMFTSTRPVQATQRIIVHCVSFGSTVVFFPLLHPTQLLFFLFLFFFFFSGTLARPVLLICRPSTRISNELAMSSTAPLSRVPTVSTFHS